MTFNNRVLIVDDEAAVRDAIRESLTRRPERNEALDAASASLFDEPAPRASKTDVLPTFEITECSSGSSALAAVRKAADADAPFALVFMDMRMPEWDGLETVRRLRKIDERVEVVFITAYSDHSIEEIVEKAGPNVGYYCKPFSPAEVIQIATKATFEWNRIRGLERLLEVSSGLRGGLQEVEPLLNNILAQVADHVGSRSAAILQRVDGGGVRCLFRVGQLSTEEATRQLMDTAVGVDMNGDYVVKQLPYVFFSVGGYFVAAVVENQELRSERFYLLRLFLEQAGQVLENARLQSEMLERERLTALGLALAGVLHDLKQPISVIRSSMTLVERTSDNPQRVAQLRGLTNRAANDLVDYVEDLLSFAQDGEAQRKSEDLAALLSGLTETARALTPPEWKLEHHGDFPEGSRAELDVRKVRRAVQNLVSNAVRVMSSADTEQPAITLRVAANEGGTVRVSVEDNGPGMSTGFDPFSAFAQGEHSGGHGLGLMVVKHAAEAHGGRSSFETSPSGTRFTLTLPPAKPS